MNIWTSLGLIVRRELIERGRSKAFLASTVLTIVLIIGSMALPMFFGSRTTTHRIGVVGEGNQPIVDAALELGNEEDDGGVEIVTVDIASAAEAEAALEAESIDIALVDGSTLITPVGSGVGGSSLASLLQEAAAAVKLDALAGEGAAAVAILTEDNLAVRSLADETAEATEARVLIAFGGLVLMYFAILSYGTWTLSGVTEEKTSRVVEVLLATVRPWQLLAGKIIGIGLLGLAQFVITIAVAMVTIRVTGVVELPAVPVASIPVLVLWFVLGFALYSVGFGAAGALVSRVEDAQSVATPFTLMSILGFFVSFQVVNDPGGTFATVMSLLPPTAPFAVPVRTAFGAIPWWELALSVVLTVGAILALVRFAGRAYSGGLLRFGNKVSWKDAIRSAEA